MIIYQALYNDMICESSYETISIHKTKQGARNAVAKKVKEEHEEFNERYDYDVKEMGGRFWDFKAWDVQEIEILE